MSKDWLDITVLEDYLDGRLDAKTMNRVEREALEDPFVAEALEGLSKSPSRSLESISLLQRQLHERIAEHHHIKKTSVITWQRLSIAAAAAVVFISVGIIFWMKQSNYQDALAKQPKKIDIIIAPKELENNVKPQEQIASVKAPKSEMSGSIADKVIKAAKTNAYASNVKPKVSAKASAGDSKGNNNVLNDEAIAAAPISSGQALSYAATKTATVRSANTISGKIVDETNGEPLQNASIFINGINVGATDQKGEFVIDADSSLKNTEILIASIGYDDVKTQVRINEPLVLSMKTDKKMNDVVIRGYNKKPVIGAPGLRGSVNIRRLKAASTYVVAGKEVQDVPVANVEQLLQGKVAGLNIANSAQPVGGLTNFNEYFISKNRYSNEAKPGQKVEYKFVIKDGRPTNITTVKGLSEKFNAEAVRIIQSGPDWSVAGPKQSGASVTIQY